MICDRSNVVTNNECLAMNNSTEGDDGGAGPEVTACDISRRSSSYNNQAITCSRSNVAITPSSISNGGIESCCSSVLRLDSCADPDEISNYLSINNSRSSSCCDIPEENSPMISGRRRSRSGVEDDLEAGVHRRTVQLQRKPRRQESDSSVCCDIEIDTGAEEDEEEDDSMLTSTNSAATTATITSNKSQLNVPDVSAGQDTSVNIVDNPVSDSNENSVNHAHNGGTGGVPPHSKITTTPSNLSNCSGLPAVTMVQLKQKQNLIYFLRVIFNHCKVNINIQFQFIPPALELSTTYCSK